MLFCIDLHRALLPPLSLLPYHPSPPLLVQFSHLSAAALGAHSHMVEIQQVNGKIPDQLFGQCGEMF